MREHIESCHRVVVEAETQAFNARRKDRGRAITRYEEAVTAELLALADAGLDSFATFLVRIADGESGSDPAARAVAEAELMAARAALDAALQVPDVPTRAELDEREAHMRARATELLGRAPGRDPAVELHALRMEPEGRAEQVAEIAQVLRGAGVDPGDDVVESARAFLAAPIETPAPAPPTSPPPARRAPPAPPPPARPARVPVAEPEPAPEPSSPPGVITVVRTGEIEALEQQRVVQDQALADLEAELARLETVYESDVPQLGAADLTRALEGLLGAYRSGDLLAGRLPLVLDGVFDGLGARAARRRCRLLAEADDVQTIVVTDDPEVMQSIAHAGGMLVRWPERARRPAPAAAQARRRPAPTRRA